MPNLETSEMKVPVPTADWPVKPWVYSLDPLRGLAALAVVVNHSAKAWHLHEGSSITAFIFDWLGVWGITLFFVLSGFCIHLPQARALITNSFHRVAWRRFFQRRANRLLPTHYVALVLSAVVGGYIQTELISRPTVISFVAHVFMVHVWDSSLYNSINAVFWSIAIEVQFYCCYPAYLNLLRRFGSFWTVIGLAATGLAVYVASSVLLGGGARFVGQHLFVVSWWQWALGAALAELYVRGKAKSWTPVLTSRFAPAVWAALSFAVGLKDFTIAGLHIRFWLVPLFCAGLLGSLVVRQTRHVPLISNAGVYSYSIYLIHPVAIALLFSVAAYKHLPALMGFPMAVVLSVIASWIFFLLVERHFLSKKQRIAEPVPGLRL